MVTTLEADYLVVGAGAMGMAFIDTLLSETDATVVVVDRRHQPGGHWTVAYPFVRLRRPSAFYGEGRFHSVVSGEEFEVVVRLRIVDATYMRVSVPSMRPPEYEVAPGVRCVAPNELPSLREPFERYTVVGAGKTGIDACLWLLDRGGRT